MGRHPAHDHGQTILNCQEWNVEVRSSSYTCTVARKTVATEKTSYSYPRRCYEFHSSFPLTAASIALSAEPALRTSLRKQKPGREAVADAKQAEARPAAKASSNHKSPGSNVVERSRNTTSLNKTSQSEEKSGSKTQSYIKQCLTSEVSAWVKADKERQVRRKQKRRAARGVDGEKSSDRGESDTDSSDSLCKLEHILQCATVLEPSQDTVAAPRHKAHARKLHKRHLTAASSGNECIDYDIPYCDVVLDNPETTPQLTTSSAHDASRHLRKFHPRATTLMLSLIHI